MPENDVPTTTPSRPVIKPRQSAAQRRAAQEALGAGRQAELKQEAADRRAARARREAEAAAGTRPVG